MYCFAPKTGNKDYLKCSVFDSSLFRWVGWLLEHLFSPANKKSCCSMLLCYITATCFTDCQHFVENNMFSQQKSMYVVQHCNLIHLVWFRQVILQRLTFYGFISITKSQFSISVFVLFFSSGGFIFLINLPFISTRIPLNYKYFKGLKSSAGLKTKSLIRSIWVGLTIDTWKITFLILLVKMWAL